MNDDERVRDERAKEKEFETEIALIQLRQVVSQILLRLGVVERQIEEMKGDEGRLPY